MIAILAIARATLPMLARQKLLIVPIIAVGLSLVALIGGLIANDAPLALERAEAEMIAYMVGVFSALGGAVYAAIVGASLISREISDGTLLMLAVRPIARWKIIAGRVLGAAVFLLGALLLVALSYGVIAAIVSGMLAPFDEPFRGLLAALPIVGLSLCVSTAMSVQGRATAAIGSAIGVCLFAYFVSLYVDEWRAERHMHSYLAADVQDRLDPPDPVVGPAAWLVVRAMPFGVFGTRVTEAAEQRMRYLDELSGVRYPEDEHSGTIDISSSVYATTGIGGVTVVTPEGPAAGPAVDPAADPTGAATPTPKPAEGEAPPVEKLPAKPTKAMFDCAEVSGWHCFMGVRQAWKERYVPQPPGLHEDGGFWWALLAIPLWIVIAAVLLTRRRDLTA